VSSLLPARFENFSPVQGSLPTTPTTVAIDQATAQRYGLKVGQRLRVAGGSVSATYRISGIVKYVNSASFGGAGVAVLIPAQAQRIADEPGAWDELIVAATPSVSAKTLRARIRAVLPRRSTSAPRRSRRRRRPRTWKATCRSCAPSC
jgi:putative ABC transport system permease protein